MNEYQANFVALTGIQQMLDDALENHFRNYIEEPQIIEKLEQAGHDAETAKKLVDLAVEGSFIKRFQKSGMEWGSYVSYQCLYNPSQAITI